MPVVRPATCHTYQCLSSSTPSSRSLPGSSTCQLSTLQHVSHTYQCLSSSTPSSRSLPGSSICQLSTLQHVTLISVSLHQLPIQQGTARLIHMPVVCPATCQSHLIISVSLHRLPIAGQSPSGTPSLAFRPPSCNLYMPCLSLRVSIPISPLMSKYHAVSALCY